MTMSTTTNPFLFGIVVGGKDFADREEEIRELTYDIEGGQNVLLFSPRRYGKTSLIMRVLEKLDERRFLKVYVDLFPISSKSEFAEAYASAVARSNSRRGRIENAIRVMSELVTGFRLVVKPPGAPGEIEIELANPRKNINDVLDGLYDLPIKVARKERKKMVVVFDEFQEIVNLDGEQIEKSLRTKIQHHRGEVSYVFTGSRKHLLDEIFSDKKRALYRIGRALNLSKIPTKEFSRFITEKFRSTGITIEDPIVADILEITDSHPYYTQQLCHELWNICRNPGRVKDEDLTMAVKQVISNQSFAYTMLWESLKKTQRSLLAALAKYEQREKKEIYSKQFIDENDLTSPSSVQRASKALEDRGIIDRHNGSFVVSDTFLKEWLLHG